MDRCAAEYGRNILDDSGEWYDWLWIALCGVSKCLKSREGIFTPEIQDVFMGLDDPKIEGRYLIEESLVGSKPRAVFVVIVQDLLDGRGRFCQTKLPSERLARPVFSLRPEAFEPGQDSGVQGTTRLFFLNRQKNGKARAQATHALPLGLKTRGLRRAQALFCQR
jgi:hypothetical protein